MRELRFTEIREAYLFTVYDAWGALPTILAMVGIFIGMVAVMYGLKKLLEMGFLYWQQPKRRVVTKCTECPGKKGTFDLTWDPVHDSSLGSIAHVVLETLFATGIVVAALFAGAVGDVNIWQSPIAATGIAVIVTYILAGGLQQIGSGFFFFLQNLMVYDQYWELAGSPNVGGRIDRITPFYVEFIGIDAATRTTVSIRVPMTTVISSIWKRNYQKEKYELRYSADPDELVGIKVE
jgi:hypothetical protein